MKRNSLHPKDIFSDALAPKTKLREIHSLNVALKIETVLILQ